jgi:hypothetical protein
MFIAVLTLISIAAGVIVWYCTAIAPWGFSDSATYFSTARNFAAGKGFGIYNADGSFTPLTIFAPLYPFVLSGFAKLGIDLVTASRWMDILFFALLVFAEGLIFSKITGSKLGGLLLALLTAETPALVSDFTSLMSEPLGITAAICTVLLTVLAVKQSSRKLLIISAVLGALSILSRYALAAAPIACMLIFLLLADQPWKERIKNSVVYAMVAFLPSMLVELKDIFGRGSFGGRHLLDSIAFGESIRRIFSQFLGVVKYWMPYRTDMIPGISADVFSPILLMIFIAIFVGGLVMAFRGKLKNVGTRDSSRLLFAVILFLALYFMILFVVNLFTNAGVPLSQRILAPMLPFFYMILLASLQLVGSTFNRKSLTIAAELVIAAFFVVFNFVPLRTYALISHSYPNGYDSPVWQNRPIFTEVKKLPEGTILLSNAPDVLLFHTNLSAYRLTNRQQSGGSSIGVNDSEAVDHLVTGQCGVIVLFDRSDAVAYENSADQPKSAQIKAMEEQYEILFSDGKDWLLADSSCFSQLGH